MATDQTERLFAVSALGLEPYTALELEHIAGLPGSKLQLTSNKPYQDFAGEGGVEFMGMALDLYRANLYLRTASRVLLRIGEFYAAAFSELRKKAGRLPWERYLAPGQAVALRVTSHKSRLYHTGAIAERIAGAIADRVGSPPRIEKVDQEEVDPPQPLIIVRAVRDLFTLSLDSSGDLLHRRGYRKETAKAPLRETLAAGLLMAAGWDPAQPLIDPFCGSGTIPIEAALMSAGLAPGRSRKFAFMDWPDFHADTWESVKQAANPTPARALPAILGSDRDAGAIEISHANAARAGVSEWIQFSQRTISAIEPMPGPGWLITNPPYGLRVSANKDLRDLYAQFGNVVRQKLPGWKVAMLSSDDKLLRQTRLPFDRYISLVNGGVKVKLAIGTAPAHENSRA